MVFMSVARSAGGAHIPCNVGGVVLVLALISTNEPDNLTLFLINENSKSFSLFQKKEVVS